MRCVRPGPVEGRLGAPPSKSVLQRAVAAASLVDGASVVRARTLCDDALAALRVIEALGATVEHVPGGVSITGGGDPASATLDCGEAGLSLRMFSAVASLYDRDLTLAVRGSLASRPIGMVLEPLTGLGVRCSARDGFPPLHVRGPMRGGKVTVDGSTTSQFLTGLLLALPRCPVDSEVEVRDLRSIPYVRLTMALLKEFGATIEHDDAMERFEIAGGQRYRPVDLAVEGDWSGASFPLVAGAVAGDVAVTGLDLASPQADRAVLDALCASGATVNAAADEVRVTTADLQAFEFDATHCPDLFPPLVALASACHGTTRLLGATRLRHKESDRAAVLVDQFTRIGGRVRVDGDLMEVEGTTLTGGHADGCGDHRIAMALACAALTARAPVTIQGAGCVSKSYPAFFEDLVELGGTVERS